MANNSFLVIVHAGDHSMHEAWLQPHVAREFDLFVSYSGDEPGRYAAGCDRYEQRKAPKYAGLGGWLHELGGELDGYRAIWLPDDDLVTDTASVNTMFKLFAEQRLSLAQPAYRQYANHPVSAQHIDYLLRYTPFVFPSAPLFTPDALRACLPTFAKSPTGSSLGFIWPKLLPAGEGSVAVMDAAAVGRLPRSYDAQGDGSPSIADWPLLAEYGTAVPPSESWGFHGGIPLWSPLPEASKQPEARKNRANVKPNVRRSGKRKAAAAGRRLRRKGAKRITGRRKGKRRVGAVAGTGAKRSANRRSAGGKRARRRTPSKKGGA